MFWRFSWLLIIVISRYGSVLLSDLTADEYEMSESWGPGNVTNLLTIHLEMTRLVGGLLFFFLIDPLLLPLRTNSGGQLPNYRRKV